MKCGLWLVGLLSSANAFIQPSAIIASKHHVTTLSMTQEGAVTRRDALNSFAVAAASTVAAGVGAAWAAEEEAVEAKPVLGPFPTDWGVSKEYYGDAKRMVEHMRYCTLLEKGNENLEKAGSNCKKEMIDFVSYYRRFPNIAGKLSYSNLYTSINVLSGHYASYGLKFPVPEKRKKRLLQEYSAIEIAIKRQR